VAAEQATKGAPWQGPLCADRIAVVTGGGGSIGAACGRAFADHGADVVIVDIVEERVAEAVAGVESRGRRALGIVSDLTVDGAADTRVNVIDAGVNGQDGQTRIWRATKYPTIDTPIPIASGDEAILLVAEADLDAGDVTGAVDAINALRAKASLPTYARSCGDALSHQPRAVSLSWVPV